MSELSPEQLHAVRELDRQRRLIDQMATMHSALRDRYRLQATTFTCLILIASVVAIAFAFAGGGVAVTIAGIKGQRSTWLGWFAVFVFSFTLIDLVLDRRGKSGEHNDAVQQLATVKADYRTPPLPGHEAEDLRRLSDRYQGVMDAIPPIPERSFMSLKARHLRKVAISRWLSEHPGASRRRARQMVRRSVTRVSQG